MSLECFPLYGMLVSGQIKHIEVLDDHSRAATTGISVVDLEFPEGGFCFRLAREARAKFWKPRPLSAINHAHFDRLRATTTGTSPTDRFLNEFSAEAC